MTKTVESVPQTGQGLHSPDDGRQGLDLSRMSFVQAGAIQRELLTLEFPSTFGNSLQLAFFQVCGFFQLITVANDTILISLCIFTDSGIPLCSQDSESQWAD
jgi:hypothetical protein